MAYRIRLPHPVIFAALAILINQSVYAQSVGMRITPVSFVNEDITLVGDFFVPEHPIAALVLVHGSGLTKRMQHTAQLFAERGFAVVTWDKRGVGQSGGQYDADRNTSAENLALLADDAAAAMDWLSAQSGIASLPLGYWGISQAGWIIPLAAMRTPQTDFIALWSGPVCTVTEEVEAGIGTGGNLFSDNRARAFAAIRAQHADTDPRDSLRKLRIPGLWMFGGRDDTLPVALSIERLKGLILAGQTHFEYQLFPEGGHNMNSESDRVAINSMIEWMLMRKPL